MVSGAYICANKPREGTRIIYTLSGRPLLSNMCSIYAVACHGAPVGLAHCPLESLSQGLLYSALQVPECAAGTGIPTVPWAASDLNGGAMEGHIG